MVHLWLSFISCSKCFTTDSVCLRRGAPLGAEGLEGGGAPGELASLLILSCICAPFSLSCQTPELRPTQELAVAAPCTSWRLLLCIQREKILLSAY